MTNCQMDDNATVVNNSSTVAGTSRYITLKELVLMPKAYQKFNSINSRLTTARGIYYQDYNFTINADLILYYSDGKTESITFEVYSDKDKGYVENLVLNKEDNGEYSVYYVLYDMTYEEKLLAADNHYVKIEKMSVQRLYDFDTVGLTKRNRSDIVIIGGDCFQRYYKMERTESFSGIPDQLEFSEVNGEEKFTPVPCPEPEVSLPSHPIMLPIFNPVPWNPDPIVPSPEIVIPGGVTATPFAPIKTKTIINPQILRFRNEPGFPQDLMDVYMNPDRMFGMRGRINSLIGSGKSDYDTKKDLAFRILNLAKDPENQQTALDLLDYLNENDYTEESLYNADWAVDFFATNHDVTFDQFENWFLGKSEGYDGEYDASYWDNPDLTFPAQTLPSWDNFKLAYPSKKNSLFDNAEKLSHAVGGRVLSIYLESYNNNTCALRVSRGLNYSGVTIPYIPGKTFKGADNKYYFLGAANLCAWMKKTFGTPVGSNHLTGAQGGERGELFPEKIVGKKGIYIMIPNNPGGGIGADGFGATGHADMLENSECDNWCNFDAPGGVKDIYIWTLN